MLEISQCISIFGQIVATVPFYTRAYFDMGWYSINKSTIGRPPKYRDFPEIKNFDATMVQHHDSWSKKTRKLKKQQCARLIHICSEVSSWL